MRCAAVAEIYHITAISNLAKMANSGYLFCSNRLEQAELGTESIGYEELKARRGRRRVPIDPGGSLNDYVPFMFGPRSPMLWSIWRGNVPGVPSDIDRIAHLGVLTERVVGRGLPFVFTDGHAIQAVTKFESQHERLDEVIDWRTIRGKMWNDTDQDPDRSRRRQAEFLVHGTVPWGLVEVVGVMTESRAAEVRAIIGSDEPRIIVRPDWYYP